jgi:hypothetical protein
MKCNKKLLAVAAAGALTVATAVPALALENEIHGSFTSFYDLSNFSAVGNDGFEQGGSENATGLQKKAPTENYFVQRVRLNYNAKASDQVKLVTKFEMDYSFWGNSNFAVKRNSGGGIGADSVQIETKNLYLELNYPAVNAKIGMQGYNDSFKGVLFDDDMAGVLLSHSYSNASVSAGYFRFLDNGAVIGKNDFDMISLDGKYDVSKNFKVGAAYYYITDNRSNGTTTTPSAAPIAQDASGNPIYSTGTTFTTTDNASNGVKIHNVGLNAEGNVGPVALSGFALFQFGDRSETQLFDQSVTRGAHGYALNLSAKLPIAASTLRSDFFYVSGGHKTGFYVPGTATAGTHGGALYDTEMIMLHRDKNAKTIDQALVNDVNNYNQGLIIGTIGFDHPCTDKITSSVNAGFAAVASNLNHKGSSDYIGTELNLESNYKLTPNVTLGVRGGYVFLGDFFKGTNADNPYDMKIIANYAF